MLNFKGCFRAVGTGHVHYSGHPNLYSVALLIGGQLGVGFSSFQKRNKKLPAPHETSLKHLLISKFKHHTFIANTKELNPRILIAYFDLPLTVDFESDGTIER